MAQLGPTQVYGDMKIDGELTVRSGDIYIEDKATGELYRIVIRNGRLEVENI